MNRSDSSDSNSTDSSSSYKGCVGDIVKAPMPIPVDTAIYINTAEPPAASENLNVNTLNKTDFIKTLTDNDKNVDDKLNNLKTEIENLKKLTNKYKSISELEAEEAANEKAKKEKAKKEVKTETEVNKETVTELEKRIDVKTIIANIFAYLERIWVLALIASGIYITIVNYKYNELMPYDMIPFVITFIVINSIVKITDFILYIILNRFINSVDKIVQVMKFYVIYLVMYHLIMFTFVSWNVYLHNKVGSINTVYSSSVWTWFLAASVYNYIAIVFITIVLCVRKTHYKYIIKDLLNKLIIIKSNELKKLTNAEGDV